MIDWAVLGSWLTKYRVDELKLFVP